MEKEEKLILILMIVIVLLFGIVIYAFAINPRVSGYIIEAQSEGYEYAISQIVSQASKCQEVPVVYGDKTVNLVSVDCLK